MQAIPGNLILYNRNQFNFQADAALFPGGAVLPHSGMGRAVTFEMLLHDFEDGTHVFLVEVIGMDENHILERSSALRQDDLEALQDVFGLGGRVIWGINAAIQVDRHAPGGVDGAAGTDCRGVAGGVENGRGIDDLHGWAPWLVHIPV